MNGAFERLTAQRKLADRLLLKIRRLYGELDGELVPEMASELRAAAALVEGACNHFRRAEGFANDLRARWRNISNVETPVARAKQAAKAWEETQK